MVQVKVEGTLLWEIEDDDGVVHPINIKKALYVPKVLSCLLAPQQWAQQANNYHQHPDGTWYATKARHCILYWNQERYHRTIPWDTSINITKILSAPSSNICRMFMAAYEQERNRENV